MSLKKIMHLLLVFTLLSTLVSNVYQVFGLSWRCFPKRISGMTTGQLLQNQSFYSEGRLTLISCMRRCLEFKLCKSVNFKNKGGDCQLNVNSSSLLASTYTIEANWTYIDAVYIPKNLAGKCMNYPCDTDERCVLTKLNSHHCLKLERCRGSPKELEYADYVLDEFKPVPEAHYTCKQNLQYVTGNTIIRCDKISKTWMTPDVLCVHDSCVGDPPTATYATFEISYSGHVKNATYVCAATKINKGGLPYITCQDATGWPTPQVDCQTDVCAVDPPTVTSGNVATSYSGSSRIATYTCLSPAVNIGGSLTITCQDPGGWPTPTVECRSDLPAACGTPPPIDLPATVTHPYNGNNYLANYVCSSRSNAITPEPVEYCPITKCTDILTWRNANLSCSSGDCYTTTPVIDHQYSGKLTCTVSGRTCQKWNVNYPHLSNYHSLGDHNYCRPVSMTPGKTVFPWCFTTDPDVNWESCPVHKC